MFIHIFQVTRDYGEIKKRKRNIRCNLRKKILTNIIYSIFNNLLVPLVINIFSGAVFITLLESEPRRFFFLCSSDDSAASRVLLLCETTVTHSSLCALLPLPTFSNHSTTSSSSDSPLLSPFYSNVSQTPPPIFPFLFFDFHSRLYLVIITKKINKRVYFFFPFSFR